MNLLNNRLTNKSDFIAICSIILIFVVVVGCHSNNHKTKEEFAMDLVLRMDKEDLSTFDNIYISYYEPSIGKPNVSSYTIQINDERYNIPRFDNIEYNDLLSSDRQVFDVFSYGKSQLNIQDSMQTFEFVKKQSEQVFKLFFLSDVYAIYGMNYLDHFVCFEIIENKFYVLYSDDFSKVQKETYKEEIKTSTFINENWCYYERKY